MLRNRFYIALAAWIFSAVSVVLSVFVVIGVLGGLLGPWNRETFFGLAIGAFFVAVWGAVFQMTSAWVHDQKVRPVLAVGGPILAFVTAAIYSNAWMFYLPTLILVGYLTWFHWPWSARKKQR